MWFTRAVRQENGRRLTDLLGDEALKNLPAPVHGSQTLGKVGLIAALPLHVLTADLQHRLVHKVHRQLLTGQVDPETLSRRKRDRTAHCSTATVLEVIEITITQPLFGLGSTASVTRLLEVTEMSQKQRERKDNNNNNKKKNQERDQ